MKDGAVRTWSTFSARYVHESGAISVDSGSNTDRRSRAMELTTPCEQDTAPP
jgi:hypothetical protein